MAQYDLLLTQNVHATLTEYSEKYVNISKGGLLSANTGQEPVVLAAGTDGYILSRSAAANSGLAWIDPATIAGVTVANQGNDRVVTATGTADALNAEANLTYNTTQGLLIGSGIGIVFAAAATTYKVYTADGAVKSNITIETGSNSAAGAGDITIKAGAGVSAGGNVYFQRDTTYGDFFFGTGGAGQLPARSAETNVIYYDTGTGKLSYAEPSASGLWTDNATYVSPPASYSVRTEGDNYGFFVDYTTQTGIRGQNNGDLEILASGNIIGRADGGTSTLFVFRELRVQLNGAPGPLLSFGGHTENYLQTGDSSITGNLHIKTGDASAGGSGDLYLYIGSATGAPGNVYFGDSSAASCPLSENSSPTHVISINTSTGLLQWSAVGDVGGGVNYGADTQVPFMNGTTAFQYSGNMTFSGSLLTVKGIIRAQTATGVDYVTLTTNTFNMYHDSTQRVLFYPDITNGASAVAFAMGSHTNLTVAGAKLFELRNAGVSKFYVDKDGNTYAGGSLLTTSSGTVTAVNNGNGMNFTNITTSGTVTLGTPGNITYNSTNGVTTSSHTHNITTGIATTLIVRVDGAAVDNDYAKFTANGLEGRTYSELVSDIDASAFTFTNNNQHTGGSFKFADNVELEMGTGNDVSVYFSGSHLYFDSLIAATDIYFRTVTTQKFKFDMGSASGGIGTGLDWVATSDVRVKTNITPFELDMDQFLVLGNKAIRHNWKADPMGSSSIGFIAQDVERFFPELVSIGRDRPHMRALSYGKLVTVAIKATAQTWEYVVAVDGKLDVVRSEVEDLKIEVEDLKKQLNTLQNG